MGFFGFGKKEKNAELKLGNFEMQWKQLVYKNHGDAITFEIVPMANGDDIILVPNEARWNEIEKVFSAEEKVMILNAIKDTPWKRKLVLVEADGKPFLTDGLDVKSGMIEMTDGYKKISAMNLFNPESNMTIEQVKQIYYTVEVKYAAAIVGKVVIPNSVIIPGSVMEQVTLPEIRRNPNAQIEII